MGFSEGDRQQMTVTAHTIAFIFVDLTKPLEHINKSLHIMIDNFLNQPLTCLLLLFQEFCC